MNSRLSTVPLPCLSPYFQKSGSLGSSTPISTWIISLNLMKKVNQQGSILACSLRDGLLKAVANTIPRPLKTKHMRYYLGKCTFPVFLVLIDVQNNGASRLFTQGYGGALGPEQLRNKKTITVRFSMEDNLANIDRFRAAVFRRSETYARAPSWFSGRSPLGEEIGNRSDGSRPVCKSTW